MFDVFGFYKFEKIKSLKKNKSFLQNYLFKKNVRGTIILAPEGINATISGKAIDLKITINTIKKIFGFKKYRCFFTSNATSTKHCYRPFFIKLI